MALHRPIIPWIGGKRRLAPAVLSEFVDHTCYVEAFAGGAALFFMKEPSQVEVLNDINGELVNLYRVVQHHLEEFTRQFKWAISSRQVYEWEKMKRPETLTDIQRAARFFYLQKLSFGAKIESRTFGTATTTRPRLNLLRLEEELSQAHLRLQGAYIENLSWEEVVRRYDRPHTLHYLDPPYWQTAGYGVAFPFGEYERMARLACEVEGAMLITLNDHPDIRQLFDIEGLHMESVGIRYAPNSRHAVQARELLIWNDQCQKRRS